MLPAARGLLLLAIVSLVVVGGATPCLACACPARTPKTIIEDADAAFVGRVEGVVFIDPTRSIQTFGVEGVYSGILGPVVSAHVELAGECPAVLFPQGERVGVVLRLRADGSYAAAACDFIPLEVMERVGGAARPPLARPSAPGPAVADPVEDAGTSLPFWAVAGLGALAALVLIGIVTRGRGSTPPADEDLTTEEGAG